MPSKNMWIQAVVVVLATVAWCLSGSRAEAGISWNVAGSGNWDTSTANWSGDSTTFTDNGTVDVTFDNAAGGTITISPDMSPLSTTVSAASGTYTLTNGPIDSGSMTKSGAGTLRLTSTNTFPGGFTLNAGIVECAHLTPVFGSGTITLNGGKWTSINNGKGDHTNAVVINGSFQKGHNAYLLLRGPVTLTGGTHTISNLLNSIEFTGVVNDGGNGYGLIFTNSVAAASVKMSGASTYTGKTTIYGGAATVLLKNEGVASGFGQPTGADSNIDLYNDAILKFMNGTDSDRTINIAGDGVGTYGLWVDSNATATMGGVTVTGTGEKTLVFFKYANPGRLTVNGAIPDADDGSKVSIQVPFGTSNANNLLALNGTNTFSGTISIGTTGAGSLKIGGSGCLGSGIFTNMISIASGSTLDYASSVTQELSGTVSGGGAVTVNGPGQLTLSSLNTYTNGTTITGGTLYASARGALGTGNVTVGASGLLVMTEDNAISTNATLNLPNATTQTLIMNAGGCEIAALNLGGVPQPNGKYSASGYAWMGGSGSLYVGIPRPPSGTFTKIR